MELTLIIVVSCLSVVVLSLVIVAIVLIVKSNKKPASLSSEIQSTEQIKASIESLKETIPLQVSKSVSDQMVTINKNVTDQMIHVNEQLAKQAEVDNQRLIAFQNTINTNLTASIKTLNDKVDLNLKSINDKVDKSLTDGFKGTSDSMEKLQKALGEIGTAQKNIESLSGEVVSLKGILSNNQQRGKYGEMQLEMILAATFDESTKGTLYDTQYLLQKAGDGLPELKPDAVVFLDGAEHHQIICIDSKFSLIGYESLFDSSKTFSDAEKEALKTQFKGALKLRINETSKYVIRGRTVNQSIMFIPNDGIFAFVENEFSDLVEYARGENVILASPTILQPLIATFKVVQIDAAKSKNIEKINLALNALSDEFDRFIPRWEKLQKDIGSLSKSSDQFATTVTKIDRKFDRIQSSKFDQPEEIENPDEPEKIESSEPSSEEK